MNENQPEGLQYAVPIIPQENKEKKKIKKTALIIGIMLLVFHILTTVYGVILGFITVVFQIFNIDISFLSNPAVTHIQQIALSSLLFTVPFIVIAKIRKKRISDLVPLGRPQKKTALPLFLLGISFCSFANIATSYAGEIFQGFGINYDVDFGEDPKGIFGFLLVLISTVIVPALVEEFAFRGIVLSSVKRFGEGFSIIVSAVLFGLMHSNFIQIPFAFLVGLILGFIRIKSGSLWIAIAVHGFNNFISVAFSYLLADISSSLQNTLYTFFLLISLALGILSLNLLKNNDEIYKLAEYKGEASAKQRGRWFFLSPTIIIFTVICILEACAYFLI